MPRAPKSDTTRTLFVSQSKRHTPAGCRRGRVLHLGDSRHVLCRHAGRHACSSCWKRLPDLHGQRSLRPSFSSSHFSPPTIRRPLPTLVSDGNPLRRLLIGSKAVLIHLVPVLPVHRSTLLMLMVASPHYLASASRLAKRPRQNRLRNHRPRIDV